MQGLFFSLPQIMFLKHQLLRQIYAIILQYDFSLTLQEASSYSTVVSIHIY